jgi:hypothetical protein
MRDALDDDGLADLRTYLGWARPTAEVKAADSYAGTFQVLGSHRSDAGRIQQQRTWLRDEETGEVLVVLDFSAGMTPMAAPQLAGTVVTTTVSRYPGTPPRRALFADEPVATGTVTTLGEAGSVAGALDDRAARLGAGPWLDRVPVTLGGATLVAGAPPSVRDAAGDRLDLVDDGVAPWSLLALTGGHPADVFGELEGGRFRPLSVAVDGRLVAL